MCNHVKKHTHTYINRLILVVCCLTNLFVRLFRSYHFVLFAKYGSSNGHVDGRRMAGSCWTNPRIQWTMWIKFILNYGVCWEISMIFNRMTARWQSHAKSWLSHSFGHESSGLRLTTTGPIRINSPCRRVSWVSSEKGWPLKDGRRIFMA